MDSNDVAGETIEGQERRSICFLFRQYYNRLYRFAAHYLCDPDAAHDISQGLFCGYFREECGIEISLPREVLSFHGNSQSLSEFFEKFEYQGFV